MASIIDNLEGDDDAVLLMYLADELERDERAVIETRMAIDPALRAKFDALHAAHGAVMDGLAELDRHDHMPVSRTSAVRQVSREIVRRQMLAAAEAAAAERRRNERPRGFRIPSWAYPPAVAALLFVGFMTWWGYQSPGPRVVDNRHLLDGDDEGADQEGPAVANAQDDVAPEAIEPEPQPEATVVQQESAPEDSPDDPETLTAAELLAGSLEMELMVDMHQRLMESDIETEVALAADDPEMGILFYDDEGRAW